MISVRVVFTFEDLDQLHAVVQNADMGGHFYGGVTARSPRSLLLARIRDYLAQNGMPIDRPAPIEWDEEQRKRVDGIATKLWNQG